MLTNVPLLLQELDTSDPLCPDWCHVAGLDGGGVAQSLYKNPIYSTNGRGAGSDYSFQQGHGHRFVNTSSSSAATVSRVQFDNVGKYVDGDFTMGCFVTPELGTQVDAYFMSIGKPSDQQPVMGVGVYGSLGRRKQSWNGTSSYTGSNNDVVWGEPYFVALRYDSVADTLQGRWYNLLDNSVLEFNQTGKTWPTSIQTSLSLGGHHRSTAYYDPMEGTMSRAMYWDRQISDDELEFIAANDKHFLRDSVVQPAGAPVPSAALTGTVTSSIDEDDIAITGSKTYIVTTTNDTFVAAGTGPIGSTADTQAYIDSISAASSPTNGWNNEVRDKALTSEIVRTDDNTATWTIAVQAGYDISAQETIGPQTIPGALLTSGIDLVVDTGFTIDPVSAIPAGGLGLLGVGI